MLTPEQKLKRMPLFGKMLRWLAVVRIYVNGDGLGAVFNWWHPITWLFILAMIPVCAFSEESVQEVVPLRVGRYFRNNPERLQWL